jgi:nitrite reductase/ring-hydroxylating ferredoxin subunit/DMSO/TMAO reductase YedYZ heme-binding membrane subunit
MSISYVAVQWNRQKRIYDLVLAGGLGLYLVTFGLVTKVFYPYITDEILLMRAFGSAAFVMLHVILCIGPLTRLDRRFLPLLYNRRHAGVTLFLVALVHAVMVIATYHVGSSINPFVSIFVSSPLTPGVAGIPFQPFGFFALFILLLMAATSHDFWLANLTAPVWKALHMLVYVAYALLVLHVAGGILQSEIHPFYIISTGLGLLTVISLHLIAGKRESKIDNSSIHFTAASEEFIDVCGVDDIPENRAKIVVLSGERVAIFKHNGIISAVSNVCQHQNGPLGEGKILDGCITCPWHGYQYVPETGASPPPFVEKVPTFNSMVRNRRVLVHPKPNLAGTAGKQGIIESA